MARMEAEIPQIIAIARLSKNGKLFLGKAVGEHLGVVEGQPLFFSVQEQVLLTSTPCDGEKIVLEDRTSIRLPALALQALEHPQPGERMAFVKRPGAVAVKRVDVDETGGEYARLYDLEFPRRIVRRVETNPSPEKLLPVLRERFSDLALKADVTAFLVGRKSLAMWIARRLLQIPEQEDGSLQDALIHERLARQSKDGSWRGNVIQTARNLHELADLGLDRAQPAIQRGVGWLVNRARSEYNPGMFFASDELVALQAEVVAERQCSGKGRFRELRVLEKKAVMNGDDLIANPCGHPTGTRRG